jgi:hypothetical protein
MREARQLSQQTFVRVTDMPERYGAAGRPGKPL